MPMRLIKRIFITFTLLYISSQIPCLILQSLIFSSELYAQESSQQEIQAAMIIKFTDFIEWPNHSFEDNSDQFTIAFIGENEYQGLFEPFEKRYFHGKKLKLVHYPDSEHIYTDIDNIGKIQILVVSKSEKKRIKPLLDQLQLKGKPILTIGDFPGFTQNGGIINFFKKANNRIGFEINMRAKELADIKISSHLLRLAKIVTPENRK